MFCSKCGNAIEEGELFCGNCGTPVRQEGALPKKNTNSKSGKKTIILIIPAIVVLILAIAGIILIRNSANFNASIMRLTDYTGSVSLTDDKGKSLEVEKDKRLFDGNELDTGKESKAWVLLDEDRFVTVMERSTVGFSQSGKNLKLSLEKGDLFFNIARDLESDESFEISVSTMVIGIRGTSGYVSADEDGYPVLYLTSGKVGVTVYDEDLGREYTRIIQPGNICKIIIDDDNYLFVDEVTEYDLPANAVIEIAGDKELLDEVCRDTGWDKDILLDLKDSYENPEETYESSDLTDSDIIGTWELDTELSTGSSYEVRAVFDGDKTGYFEWSNGTETAHYDFTWTLYPDGRYISLRSDTSSYDDTNMIYKDGHLHYGNAVYTRSDTGESQSGLTVGDVVGRYELTSGTWRGSYIQFNSDMYGFYESENYSTGAKVIVTFRWEIDSIPGWINMYTDSPADTYQIFTIGSIFMNDDRINFTAAEDVPVVFTRVTTTDDHDIPTIEVSEALPDPVEWTYDDYLYYSAWNGAYTDPSTGNTLELFIGAPATGAGNACGRMSIFDSMTFLGYYGDGCFEANYSEGYIRFWLLEDSIKIEYPIGSGTYYYYTK